MESNVHPESILGRVMRRLAETEGERDRKTALLDEHTQALDGYQSLLNDLSSDAEGDVAALLASIQAREFLRGRTRREVDCLVDAVKLEKDRIGMLSMRRDRYVDRLAALEDENRIVPFSPTVRRWQIAVNKFLLAALTGDPTTLTSLREEAEAEALRCPGVKYSASVFLSREEDIDGLYYLAKLQPARAGKKSSG